MHVEKRMQALRWIRWRCTEPLDMARERQAPFTSTQVSTKEETSEDAPEKKAHEACRSTRGVIRLNGRLRLVLIRHVPPIGLVIMLSTPGQLDQEGPIHVSGDFKEEDSLLAFVPRLVEPYKTFCARWLQQKLVESRVRLIHMKRVSALQSFTQGIRAHLELQRLARRSLMSTCHHLRSHQAVQISTRASLCNIIETFTAHHAQRCRVKREMCLHAHHIREHRSKQHQATLELCSLASYVRVHNFARQRVAEDLREAVAQVASRQGADVSAKCQPRD